MKGRRWRCDGCHKRGAVGRDPHWVATIEIVAAADPVVLDKTDLSKDLDAEMRRLLKQIEKAPEHELKDEVHKKFRFTLCRACQKRLLRHPLPVTHRHDRDPSRN